MSNLRVYWMLGIVMIILILVTFLYPGSAIFGGASSSFYLFMKLFAALGSGAFIVFLVIELANLTKRGRELELKNKELLKRLKEETVGAKHISLMVKRSPDEVYSHTSRTLLRLVKNFFFARDVAFYLIDSERKLLLLEFFEVDTNVNPPEKIKYEGTLFNSVVTEASGKVFPINDTDEEELSGFNLRYKSGCLMFVPVKFDEGQAVGLLVLLSPEEGAWGDSDVQIAEKFSELFSTIIWQIDAIDKLSSVINFYQELNKLQADTPIGIEELEFFKKASGIISRFFDFDKMTVAIYNDEKNEMQIRFVEGIESDATVGDRFELEGGLWEKLTAGEGTLLIEDYDSSDIGYRFQPDDVGISPFRSCLGVALRAGKKLLGGILLESTRKGQYSESDRFAFEIFGRCVGSAYNRLLAYNDLKSLSMIDGLTSIYNRRAFEERLSEEINRAKRYGSIFTLLVIDIDKFKRINDTYGHLMGDFVLKKLAMIIKGSVRNIDTVARYGGEEFAVVLVNANKENALISAERIRSNVEEFLFEKGNVRLHIRVSIGLSEFPADAESGRALIQNADMAMYESKRRGGNVITVFQGNNQ